MISGKPLCITYTAIGTKHEWKISNDYYAGQPILKIAPLNGALCRHKNVRVCPIYGFSNKKDFQNFRKNEKRDENRKRNYYLGCLFVILLSVFVYARNILVSVREMNFQEHKLELFLDNLEQRNFNALCFAEGEDDAAEE